MAYPQSTIEGISPSEISKFPMFKKMTFRQPITFTPLDVKIGYLYYGGEKYSSNFPFNSSLVTADEMPVLLDSTQYGFNIIEQTSNRRLFFMELDMVRTNLTHYFFHQNYVDIQMGLGFQMINFLPDLSLPSKKRKEWLNESTNKGEYFFHPKSIGLNLNTSLAWQLSYSHYYYVYHSMGISSVSVYESAGNKKNLTGIGLSESFGIGTKFVFEQENANFNYTLGLEAKWNRLYLGSIDAPEDFSPIEGLDIRSSGIFLTYGIQFGGNKTDGDIAYALMMESDFMGATENFKKFLDAEQRHIHRKTAIEMLQYCQSQISYQQVKIGMEYFLDSEYDKSIEWFDTAEINANEQLKEELILNRKIISSQLLDSVINNKNMMSMTDSKKLADIAKKYDPKSIKYKQVIAGLYIDRANLNIKINNFSEAINNYQKALELYPEIEPLINEKIENIIDKMMEDAYFSFQKNNMLMVLNLLQYLIEIQPQREKELDPYIVKIKKIIKDDAGSLNIDFKEYMENEKHSSLPLDQQGIQLGMKMNKVKIILGNPKHKQVNGNFESWTYLNNENVSTIYFRDGSLIKIEK